MTKDTYESPLASRYASREMLYLFSPDKKFTTWRRLWIALARAEMELGLPVTQAQIDELEREKDHIEDAIASYVNVMSPALYAALSEGNNAYLKEHDGFGEQLRDALEKMERMLSDNLS